MIDATGSLVVVHQDHDYSHLPGGQPHYRLPETTENTRLAGGRRAIFTLLDADYADFWLAFDEEGAKLARQIIQKSGKSIEAGRYDFPGMVHLFEHEVPDPPREGDINPWVITFVELIGTLEGKDPQNAFGPFVVRGIGCKHKSKTVIESHYLHE